MRNNKLLDILVIIESFLLGTELGFILAKDILNGAGTDFQLIYDAVNIGIYITSILFLISTIVFIIYYIKEMDGKD